MPKKLTYEFVKQSFEEEGYTLLSTTYINSTTKLKYKCPLGHEHSIVWGNWKTGYRCPYCANQPPIDISYVKDQFILEGYILVSKVYVNAHNKLDFICSNGHTGSISWNKWKSGVRCSKCYGNSKILFEDVFESFSSCGYTLLSSTVENAHSYVDYICPDGHNHTIRYSHWAAGHKCPTCAIINSTGNKSVHWRGGRFLEEYCDVWKDKEYKQAIKDRDGNLCLNPYCNSKNPSDLTIHHIDYDKQNCHPSNLITVCRSCNSAANKDRRWHKAWYQAIMYRRTQ